MIYFDNAATTKIDEYILNGMNNVAKDYIGNPSSSHFEGIRAKNLIIQAKNDILTSLKLKNKEIIFTSGATESNNLALIGFARSKNKGHIISVKTEHDSVLNSLSALQNEGYEVTYLDVDSYGQINPDQMKTSIRENTILISFSIVNNETGIIQKNYRDFIKIAHEKSVFIHIDAVQTLGHIDIDYNLFDIITITSHKIFGPKGIGCVIINDTIKLKPLIFGGGQENNIRGGTENISGIYGFSLAVKNINRNTNKEIINQMNKIITKEALKYLPNIILNGSEEFSVPHIMSFTIPNINGETIVKNLSNRNICISSGSACIQNSNGYSHVIYAMTGSEQKARNTIRISICKNNTIEECKYFINALIEVVREISKFEGKYL